MPQAFHIVNNTANADGTFSVKVQVPGGGTTTYTVRSKGDLIQQLRSTLQQTSDQTTLDALVGTTIQLGNDAPT